MKFILFENEVKFVILAFITGMNLYTLLLFNSDKRRAIKGSYRISEKKLLTSAFLLGGIGAWLGMVLFRHKTKHLIFRISLPFSMLITVLVIYGTIK
ncbi:DUF1294 domain-containing protein, partial [Alkalibacterium gilvum]